MGSRPHERRGRRSLEVRRSIFVLSLVAGFTGSGCLSSATLHTRREVAAELDSSSFGRGASEVAADGDAAAPPSARAADCAALAEAIVRAHPAVHAGRARASAALARSRAEGALPAPEVYVEAWNVGLGSRGGNGMYMGGVVQELPAARSRDRMARAEAEEARASLGELAETERALFRELAHACVDWSAAEVRRASVAGHRSLYAETLEAAVARYGTGGETLGRVARIEAEVAAVERRLAEAEADAEAARAALEALAQDLAPIPAQAPALRERDAGVEIEQLVAAATASRGDVRAAEARARGAAARADAARAEARAPRFVLRATYMQEPGADPGLGAMASMSLPWLWGGGRDRRDAAEALAAAAQAEAAATGRSVRADLARAAAKVVALRRALEVLVTRELPAAERALEAERAGLAAGAFDLVAWIDAAHALESARSDVAVLRGELEHALVELETSMGRSRAGAGAEVEP